MGTSSPPIPPCFLSRVPSSPLHMPGPVNSRPLCFSVPVEEFPPSSCAKLPMSSILLSARFSPMIISSVLTCGAFYHRQQGPCSAELHFCFISVLHGLHFPFVEGRQLRGPPLWGPLRCLHSNSETHFYLFTVNSYRCSQQFRARLSLPLASPLGFQDKLPRNCLNLLPGLSLFRLEITLVYRQELIRSETQASASV